MYKARDTTVIQTAGTMHKAPFGDIEQGLSSLVLLKIWADATSDEMWPGEVELVDEMELVLLVVRDSIKL